ncbi:MAG: hypothetical protein ACE5G9_06870, partial [Nitrospinales bacterium]
RSFYNLIRPFGTFSATCYTTEFMDEKGKTKLDDFIKNKLDLPSLKCGSIYLLGVSGENLWRVK